MVIVWNLLRILLGILTGIAGFENISLGLDMSILRKSQSMSTLNVIHILEVKSIQTLTLADILRGKGLLKDLGAELEVINERDKAHSLISC